MVMPTARKAMYPAEMDRSWVNQFSHEQDEEFGYRFAETVFLETSVMTWSMTVCMILAATVTSLRMSTNACNVSKIIVVPSRR
jgi:hypothetical protein